jgi:hypothetical protein
MRQGVPEAAILRVSAQDTLNGLDSPGLIAVGSGSVFATFAPVAAPGGVPVSFDDP